MQEIFTLTPYKFIPARKTKWVSRLSRWLRWHRSLIWKIEGVRGAEVRGGHHLLQSIAAGQSVLLAANHSRTADPIAFGFLEEKLGLDLYVMASRHVFSQGWLTTQFVQAVGAFSVNREGLDRAAIDYALQILESNDRPLIIFPEGSTSRTADRLMPFLDGLSFMARAGAKKRAARDGGRTVIHPVAFRYRFEGDIRSAVEPILDRVEKRLSWNPGRVGDLLPRIQRLGMALVAIKEIEICGSPQSGTLEQRLANLIERLLQPLEEKWLGRVQTGNCAVRIKTLRTRILPEMTEGKVPESEMPGRFSDLRDTYVAHQMACFPLGYLNEYPSVDRVRETVERFEEDVTDTSSLIRPLKCIIEVGPAIEVGTEKTARRGGDGDPLMQQVADQLQGLLTGLARESPLYQPTSNPAGAAHASG
jgi:1-acyl-sn-glycerol-3-phosphate acyltransferase